jgi:hypothetical protein
MRLSRTALIVFSALSWLGIGVFLMVKGLKFIVAAAQTAELSSTMQTVASMAGGREQGALALICIALLIGFIKGRMILVKTVKRVIDRIHSLPDPIRFRQIYAPRYYALIGTMVLLGLSFNFIGIGLEWRGLIDVAIGSALVNGASSYIRFALIKRHPC